MPEAQRYIVGAVAASRFHPFIATVALWGGICAAQEGPASEALIRQGLIALQSRDVAKAQEFLERAVEAAPNEARAWIGLSQVYRILNLHRQATRHAEEAVRLGGDDPLIQHALAMFYTDYGNWAEAARWEEKFARGDRGNEDAYLRTVSLYLQADMPLKAAEVGQAALELGETGRLHNALGKAFAIADRPQQGLKHLQLAIEKTPYEESFHYDLGYFHLRRLDFESAAAAFRSGQKYFDKSAAIEIGLGIAAYGQRRFQDAVGHFLRSAELDPDFEQPHVFVGALLQHANHRISDIESRMRVFYQEFSESHFGPFLYGKVLHARLGTKRDPAAIASIETLLRESIERNDEFWEAHYELGVLLEKKKDYAAAEQHLERAVDLNPNASKPHYRLARVYQRLGKPKEAKRERELHKQIAERERQTMRSGGLPPELAAATGAARR